MYLTLCIVQFDRSENDPEVNRQKMLDLVGNLTRPADIILLPEDWLGPLIVDSAFYDAVIRDLQSILPGEEVLLVSGAQYVRCSEKTISTGAFVCSKWVCNYDKLFPSLAIGERDIIMPGKRLPVIRHRGMDVAAAVCVDLFYPEITRHLAAAGAVILFNPASIPASRIKLWHSIGITRAAENTVFLAMANNTRTRYPDGREVNGGSFVAGPDGRFFQALGPEPGTFFIELDTSLVRRVRKRWPYLSDMAQFNQPQILTEHYNTKNNLPPEEKD